MASKTQAQPTRISIQATAVMTACYLSGAMMSLSAIAVPVLLDTTTESYQLLQQWARMYHYGHIYMPALSVSATGLYGYVAVRERISNHTQWLLYAGAGASTISMVPFTWFLMAPTNKILFQFLTLASTSSADVDISEVERQIVKWSWLHVVRSIFPFVGAVLGLVATLQESIM